MSPLLPPEPRKGRHRCEPPLEPHRVQVPRGPGAGVPVTREHLEEIRSAPPAYATVGNRPPAPGTTWDCPQCGRVWVVVVRPGRGASRYGEGHSPAGRVWVRASRRLARRHHERALDVLFPPPFAADPDAPDDFDA
jgi:hypothetical protein